ncbi:MAG TPA: cupredoxin domain-containing protein [Solirubrobacteraceae bacterium]|nr:cupredoxin domain-containing protein [Solirubrobacteraceae bacterium]
MDHVASHLRGGLEHLGGDAGRRHAGAAVRATRGRLALAALTVIAALGVAGCGGDGDDGGEAGGVKRLEATEFAFSPAQVTVAPGEHEFRIVNRGDAEHALEIHTPGGEVETDRVAPGESATVTANLSEPGTYELYCPVGNHRERGMEGTVTVEEGGGGESSSPQSGGGGGGGY